jgi:chitin synthase
MLYTTEPITVQIKPVLTGVILPDLSEVTPTGDTVDIDAWHNTAIYVLIIQIAAAYLCYIFGTNIICIDSY